MNDHKRDVGGLDVAEQSVIADEGGLLRIGSFSLLAFSPTVVVTSLVWLRLIIIVTAVVTKRGGTTIASSMTLLRLMLLSIIHDYRS